MFERGFKTWCERYAVEKRVELGLKSTDPLNAFKLAENLQIRVWTPNEVPGLNVKTITTLLRNDGKTPASNAHRITSLAGPNSCVIGAGFRPHPIISTTLGRGCQKLSGGPRRNWISRGGLSALRAGHHAAWRTSRS